MRFAILLALVLTLTSLSTVVAADPDDQALAEWAKLDHCEHFPQTDHSVCSGFRAYWHQFGGLEIFGYPISNEFSEDGKTVQYFERARFEWHPGVWPERYDVLLGLLGVELTADLDSEGSFAWVGEKSDDDCVYFAVTGHNVCGNFLKRWNMSGGLAVFGYPISEAYEHDGMLVQYFQRQRMEHQPGVWPERHDVLLGLLGAESYRDASGDEGAIKIGVRTALSGPVSSQGQEILNSVQLAVDEWNENGGVAGRMIEVVAVDDASNPDRAITVSEELCADEDVVGVVGSFQSAAGIPSSAVLNGCSLAYVAPGETNPLLTDRGLNNVNRVSPRDDDQGPALAIYAKQFMGADKVFVIDDQSTGGKGLADAFVDKAAELELETERGTINVGDTDFRDILNDVPDDVDALVFYGFLPEGALIAQQWHELGHTQPILGGDPLYEQEGFIDASEGAAEGAAVTFVGPDIRSVPEAADYVEAYERKYGPVQSYGPQAYEAANIILKAIERSGSVNREQIRDAVRQTSNYQGILGISISFDEKGDIEGGTIFVFRVINGVFVQDEMITTR